MSEENPKVMATKRTGDESILARFSDDDLHGEIVRRDAWRKSGACSWCGRKSTEVPCTMSRHHSFTSGQHSRPADFEAAVNFINILFGGTVGLLRPTGESGTLTSPVPMLRRYENVVITCGNCGITSSCEASLSRGETRNSFRFGATCPKCRKYTSIAFSVNTRRMNGKGG